MEKEREIRVLPSSFEVERRDGEPIKIRGYAAVFEKDSEDMGFIERIKPGAFKNALRNSDVRVLFNHDPNIIIGRSRVNLKLKEDDIGLHMEVTAIDDEDFRRVARKIEQGLVTQQSFGFTIAKDGDEWSEDYRTRTISKVARLYDVSPVTYPAYPDTTVAYRSMEKAKGNVQPIEKRDKSEESEKIELKDNEKTFVFDDEKQMQRVYAQLKKRYEKIDDDPTLPKQCDDPTPIDIDDATQRLLLNATKILRDNRSGKYED